MKRTASLLLLALPLASSLGCDPQESADYPGEPLVAVRGSVTVSSGSATDSQAAILWYASENAECSGPELACDFAAGGASDVDFDCVEACGDPVCDPDAVDAWLTCANACEGVQAFANVAFEGCATGAVGERVALSVESFPSDFELALYDTPPPTTLLQGSDDGPRVAMGVLVALDDSAPEVFDFDQGTGFNSIVGGVTTHALIYAADPIPADSSWGQYLGGAYDAGYHLVRYEADVQCETFNGVEECYYTTATRSPETRGFDVDLELEFAPLDDLFLPF